MRKSFRPTLLLLVAVFALSFSAKSSAQVGISVSFGPPALPVYEQPVCPADGYIWTPGYWAWDADDQDYYWVPGTWVEAPEVGYLWTPPWWGWGSGAFLFHEGFWGPTVGFYGGIDYGFGYFGSGFVGGRWQNDHFYYNRAVMNVNERDIHNVYQENVNHEVVNHVSFNGGPGGINARPTAEEERATSERHVGPVAAQQQLMNTARSNPELRANQNHGRPPIAATSRPTEFRGDGVVAAKEAGGEYHPPANRNAQPEANRGAEPRPENNAGKPAVHPKELPPMERPSAPNTGNAKQDQKYQQQQEKLYNQQQQERQQLQARQEQEHQKMQKAPPARTQQMEQKHQQQTQHLQQKQTQQQQHLRQRQQPAPRK